MFTDPARLWTIGVSAGTAIAPPWVILTLHGTIAPIPYTFIELGGDVGFMSRSEKVESYYSMYPFAHFAFFVPFDKVSTIKKGGWYLGGGGGYMMAHYKFAEGEIWKNTWAIDMMTGFNFFNVLDISYTLRVKPDFSSASNKLSIGLVYRF